MKIRSSSMLAVAFIVFATILTSINTNAQLYVFTKCAFQETRVDNNIAKNLPFNSWEMSSDTIYMQQTNAAGVPQIVEVATVPFGTGSRIQKMVEMRVYTLMPPAVFTGTFMSSNKTVITVVGVGTHGRTISFTNIIASTKTRSAVGVGTGKTVSVQSAGTLRVTKAYSGTLGIRNDHDEGARVVLICSAANAETPPYNWQANSPPVTIDGGSSILYNLSLSWAACATNVPAQRVAQSDYTVAWIHTLTGKRGAK